MFFHVVLTRGELDMLRDICQREIKEYFPERITVGYHDLLAGVIKSLDFAVMENGGDIDG